MITNHLNMGTEQIPPMMCVHCIRYTSDSGKCHIIVVICKQFGISWFGIRLLFVLIFLYSLNKPHNNQIFVVVLNVLHQMSITCLYNRRRSYFWWQCFVCAILNFSSLMTGRIFSFQKFFMYEKAETKIHISTSVIDHRKKRIHVLPHSVFSAHCTDCEQRKILIFTKYNCADHSGRAV
jgi:hypothetical protein